MKNTEPLLPKPKREQPNPIPTSRHRLTPNNRSRFPQSICLACTVIVVAIATGARAGTTDVPVLFTNTTTTSWGESVFVVGNIPQLGNWDPTRAVKLVVNSCAGSECDWSVTIGIPEGTAYEYKFIKRNDCPTCYADPGNVIWEQGPNRTGVIPSGPAAPYKGKTVLYYSGWSSVSLVYSNSAIGWTAQPMVAVGPGRSPTESLWQADGINAAGETNLVFVFSDNNGGFDNPNGPGTNYGTPLDAFLVQDGQIYNYWPPSSVSSNRVVTFSMTSTNVTSRTIRVYLPRGYNENVTKRYPVLYMHDGQNLFLGMGTFGCWNADTNAANLIRFGKMRETIIVGVDNTSDRYREYTPPECSPPVGGTALGGKYAAFLVHELKPFIDANYRTLPDPENTGVLGSSMGGLISAYLGWNFPDVFTKVGAMSSSFEVCFPIPSPASKRPVRIYLDSGNLTDVDDTDALAYTVAERDNLIRNGYVFNIDLDHMIGYGHTHNEYWWDRRLPRCFQFLFPTADEANAVLDSVAAPPRITDFQVLASGNVITWTSYKGRLYEVQGSTNQQFSSAMTWSNVFRTPTPELRPWNYPTTEVTNVFRFLRVRQLGAPSWTAEAP